MISTSGAKRHAGIVVSAFFLNLLLLNKQTEAKIAQTNTVSYAIWSTNSKSEVNFDL